MDVQFAVIRFAKFPRWGISDAMGRGRDRACVFVVRACVRACVRTWMCVCRCGRESEGQNTGGRSRERAIARGNKRGSSPPWTAQQESRACRPHAVPQGGATFSLLRKRKKRQRPRKRLTASCVLNRRRMRAAGKDRRTGSVTKRRQMRQWHSAGTSGHKKVGCHTLEGTWAVSTAKWRVAVSSLWMATSMYV